MRELNLVPLQPKPYKRTTIPGEPEQAVADLVDRNFSADRPGVKLVGDITYIPTWQGWLYLATVIDCFNKEVIGYAMADHMRTELICDALAMAARNHTLEPDCIMHSDRGTQYTSAEYAAKLNELGLRQSLGRTGICWDNALAESFFASLKNERVHQMVYPTRKTAKRISRGTSNYSTIDAEFIPHSATGHHRSLDRVHEFTARSVRGRETAVRKTRARCVGRSDPAK